MPDDNHDATSEAKAFLHEHGAHFTVYPPHQLKIAKVNYWPVRGTIHIDGEPQRRPHRGLAALAEVLREQYLLPPA